MSLLKISVVERVIGKYLKYLRLINNNGTFHRGTSGCSEQDER